MLNSVMAQKYYTEGDAFALAGKIIGRLIELSGMVFLFAARLFSLLCRSIFSGLGLFIDGYNTIKKKTRITFNPEVNAGIEEAVFLAFSETDTDWEWIDEAAVPIRQILAATGRAFRNKTMKKKEILKKDREAVIMAGTLKKIVLKTMLAREKGKLKFKGVKRIKSGNSMKFLQEELTGIITNIKFIASRNPDDPAGKVLTLVKLAEATLKYHQTGKIKYRKQIRKIVNNRRNAYV